MTARSLSLFLWREVSLYTLCQDVARACISTPSVYRDTYPLLCDMATYIVIPYQLWRANEDEKNRLFDLMIEAYAAEQEREMDEFIRRTHCMECYSPFDRCDCQVGAFRQSIVNRLCDRLWQAPQYYHPLVVVIPSAAD